MDSIAGDTYRPWIATKFLRGADELRYPERDLVIGNWAPRDATTGLAATNLQTDCKRQGEQARVTANVRKRKPAGQRLFANNRERPQSLRKRLKIRCSQGREGSNPSSGTHPPMLAGVGKIK